MSRFQCVDCDHEHHTAVSCPRCRTPRGQVEVCRAHGARPVRGCGACRILTRSQSGL